jgi:acyl dehydratase
VTENLLSSIPYDDLVVGERSGPYTFRVTEELASNLAGPIGVTQSVTWTPPAVYPTIFLMALRRSMGGIPTGSILAKQQLEFVGPLAVESDATVYTWIGEKYLRRERAFVVFEFEIRNDQDEVVLTGRKVIVWPSGPGEV